jgi:hypothetical protein
MGSVPPPVRTSSDTTVKLALLKFAAKKAGFNGFVLRGVGASVGNSVGASVGRSVGASVGKSVGAYVGVSEGTAVVAAVGASVGVPVGTAVAFATAAVGSFVGNAVGTADAMHVCLRLGFASETAWLVCATDCGKPVGHSHSYSSPATGMHAASSPAPVFCQQKCDPSRQRCAVGADVGASDGTPSTTPTKSTRTTDKRRLTQERGIRTTMQPRLRDIQARNGPRTITSNVRPPTANVKLLPAGQPSGHGCADPLGESSKFYASLFFFSFKKKKTGAHQPNSYLHSRRKTP